MFWSQTPRWLLTMLNKFFMENEILTLWRQSKIMPILKPEKDSTIPKNYQPISLLCHLNKLYEIMITEEAGFRPGKSCTRQLLNLIQYIEDGYQESIINGTAFVDLSAAYDTVNHRLLIQKRFNITQDSTLCIVSQNLLSNRRLHVETTEE